MLSFLAQLPRSSLRHYPLTLLRALAIGSIYGYRYLISPILMGLFGARCRFYPSCSAYALRCFNQDPLPRALKKTMIRLSRCHPYHPGGVDEP